MSACGEGWPRPRSLVANSVGAVDTCWHHIFWVKSPGGKNGRLPFCWSFSVFEYHFSGWGAGASTFLKVVFVSQAVENLRPLIGSKNWGAFQGIGWKWMVVHTSRLAKGCWPFKSSFGGGVWNIWVSFGHVGALEHLGKDAPLRGSCLFHATWLPKLAIKMPHLQPIHGHGSNYIINPCKIGWFCLKVSKLTHWLVHNDWYAMLYLHFIANGRQWCPRLIEKAMVASGLSKFLPGTLLGMFALFGFLLTLDVPWIAARCRSWSGYLDMRWYNIHII